MCEKIQQTVLAKQYGIKYIDLTDNVKNNRHRYASNDGELKTWKKSNEANAK